MNSLFRFLRLRFLAIFLVLATLAVSAPPVAAQEPAPNSWVHVKFSDGQEGDFQYVGKTATCYRLKAPGMRELEVPLDSVSMTPIGGASSPAGAVTPSTAAEAGGQTPPSVLGETAVSPTDAETAAIEGMKQNVAAKSRESCVQAIDTGVNLLRQNSRLANVLAPILNEAFVSAGDDLAGDIAQQVGSPENCAANERLIDELIAKLSLREMEPADSFAFDRKKVYTRLCAVLGSCYGKWLNYQIELKSARLDKERGEALRMAAKMPEVDLASQQADPLSAWFVLFYKARLLAFAGLEYFVQAQGFLERAERLSVNAEYVNLTRKLRGQIADGSVPTWYNTSGDPTAAKPAPTATPQASPTPQTRVGQIAAQGQGIAIDVIDFLKVNWLLAVFAAAGVFAFWGVPYIMIWTQARRGNVFAVLYRPRVMKWGWLAYFAFLLHRAPGRTKKREKSEKPDEDSVEALLAAAEGDGEEKPGFWARLFVRRKRERRTEQRRGLMACHSCGKPVDVPALYGRTLEFDRCPHCRVEIEPVIVFEDYLADLVERITETARSPKKKKKAAEDLISSQTMTTLINGMYILAVRRRATDIHVERNEEGAAVQFRIDGVLCVALKLPHDVAGFFLSALKVQANLDITNHTTPQDGRYNLVVEGVELDMRVNCAPTTAQGEIFFTRLLDKRRIEIKPDVLGFEGKNLDNFVDSIHKPHGLILVTGPTGSGKSTTLYVAMTQINTGERNIVTIEDPVEYQVPGLKQMQVNPDKKFTFATGLRSILRQDPDVIMVGEIRDDETANMAIDAAATGHLVFTTLHTMDTATAISRLNDLGVNAKRYSSALEIIIAQRLVRMICRSCREQTMPRDPDLDRLGILKLRTSIKFMAGRGCIICNATGYYDRRALLEILKPDVDLRALMEVETRAHIIRDAARRKGMRLLREEGILKIAAGITTVEEVLRTTS